MAALDAASGRILWSFPLVPTGDAPGADAGRKGIHVGGGSVWTSLTVDTTTGALYVPAGTRGQISPATTGPARTVLNSIVVLDGKTGKLRTWYQLVPHDVHDWDQSAAPALITTKAGRKRVMAAGRPGCSTASTSPAGRSSGTRRSRRSRMPMLR